MRAALGFDRVAGLDIGGAVVADELPVGAARQDAPLELRPVHRAAGDADDAALAIGRAAEVQHGLELGLDGEDRLVGHEHGLGVQLMGSYRHLTHPDGRP